MEALTFCVVLSTCLRLSTGVNTSDLIEIPVIHINDFHARFEETAPDSSTCRNSDCIGGFSRMYATIMNLKRQKMSSIILNAGDNYQGTLWYNIHKWNVTQYFMNKIPFDAITLGNHEFDDKIEGVVPFIKNLNAPVIVANIDDRFEPGLEGTYKKSVVVERKGRKIGIIGVITKDTKYIANSENLIFLDESESINKEAERLVREKGVFTNIVVSHSGYEVEQEMAKKSTGKISLIVGGHSHSLLYSGDDVPNSEVPEGPYPTVVNNTESKPVLVVQASAFCKYVGNLSLFFDDNGNLITWEGAPIYLSHNLPQDPVINEEITPWKQSVDELGNRVIGRSFVQLEAASRRLSECTMGNFITDAMVFNQVDRAENGSWTYAAVAITNAGGLRANIPRGSITFADMIAAQPFGNTLDIGEMQGMHILEMLEVSARPHVHGTSAGSLNLLHFSGIQTTFDTAKPVGHKVTSVKIRCRQCKVPHYEDLDLDKMYKVIVPSFLRTGGDKFFVIQDNLKNIEIGDVDVNAYIKYVENKSPLIQELEGRLKILRRNKVSLKGSF